MGALGDANRIVFGRPIALNSVYQPIEFREDRPWLSFRAAAPHSVPITSAAC